MLVEFFLVRHGSHDGTNLTEKGRRQVAASAAKHLQGLPFYRVFSSGMPRAIETAAAALEGAGEDDQPVITETGFGYEFAEELGAKGLWPYEEFLKRTAARHEAGKPVTLEWAIADWPVGRTIRAGLTFTLRQWAERIASEEFRRRAESRSCERSPHLNVLVGGHATAVYAAPAPEAITGDLENAGIVRYTFEVSGNGTPARLANCQHLPAPNVEEA